MRGKLLCWANPSNILACVGCRLGSISYKLTRRQYNIGVDPPAYCVHAGVLLYAKSSFFNFKKQSHAGVQELYQIPPDAGRIYKVFSKPRKCKYYLNKWNSKSSRPSNFGLARCPRQCETFYEIDPWKFSHPPHPQPGEFLYQTFQTTCFYG